MSAWSTDGRHNAILARALVARGLAGQFTAAQVYGYLADENDASLGDRYGADSFEMGAGEASRTPLDRCPDEEVSPGELFGLAQSYRYQSCEHDAWDGSWAATTIATLLFELELVDGVTDMADGSWSVEGIDQAREAAKREADAIGRAVAAQRKATVGSVGVGSYFVHTWGYDQTNTDYYRVTSVTKSGKSVTLQRVRATQVGEDNGSTVRTVPTDEPFGYSRRNHETGEYETELVAPIRKRLQVSGSSVFVAMECGWCKLWEGQPESSTSPHAGR
jgi:hypothetical protein